MARPRDDEFTVNPWDDDEDEQRNQQALDHLLSDRADSTPAPPSSDPVSSTMPVADAPTVTPTTTPAPSTDTTGGFRGQGTGWRGLDLTPLTSRSSATPLHGFNLDRAYAGTDENSVKDAFARWATGIQTPLAGLDHAGVEGVIRQNLDRARQMGLNIMDVSGDRILIDAAEHGPMWVDVVENAGGDPSRGEIPAWAWQLQGDPASSPQSSPSNGGGVSPTAPPMMPLTGGGGGDYGQTQPDNQTALDDILAEIEALMSGQGSPMDARALQGLLS